MRVNCWAMPSHTPHQNSQPLQAEALFDSFVPIDEEDRFNMPLDGIVDFARAIGIEDPEGVRKLLGLFEFGW